MTAQKEGTKAMKKKNTQQTQQSHKKLQLNKETLAAVTGSTIDEWENSKDNVCNVHSVDDWCGRVRP